MLFKSVLPNDYTEVNLTDNQNKKNRKMNFVIVPSVYIRLNKENGVQKTSS